MKVDEADIRKIIDDLISKQILKVENEQLSTTYACNKFGDFGLPSVFELIGLQRMGAFISSSYQKDLEVFIHPFEIELNKNSF